MLPEGLRRKYQGALLSADPAVAVSGADAVAKLAAMNPALVADIPADQRQRAQAIAQYAALDLPPERAIELAEKQIEEEGSAAKSMAAEPIMPSEPVPSEGSPGEPVEPASEDGHAPDEDAAVVSDDARDQADLPFDAAGTEADRRGAANDISTDEVTNEAPSREDPDWAEIARLRDILDQQGGEAFAAAAARDGLNPEVTRLFLDLLSAKPEDQKRLFQQIDKLYGQGYVFFLKPLVSRRLLKTGNAEDWKALLELYLWQLQQDAPLDLGISVEAYSSRLPARGSRGGKPPGSGPSRQPGPARRGDFAPGSERHRAWNEMQQRIRDGLPRSLKTLEQVKTLAPTYESQMTLPSIRMHVSPFVGVR